jgi:Periplasmic protease
VKFEAVVDDLLAQGMQGMVLDLRGNGGGYLPELTEVLDYLLPEGPIFTAIDHNGKEDVILSDADWLGVPIVVLVNEGSYSAAEFCAAQLRESVDAPIVGTATSGKGYSQQAFPLPNGGAMNLSSAEYRTGGGVSLAENGIIPDYVVENTAEKDLQMEKAVEVIREMLAENY